MSRFFAGYQVQVIKGPKFGDLYEVRLPVTGQARSDLVEQMRRNAIVDLIATE